MMNLDLNLGIPKERGCTVFEIFRFMFEKCLHLWYCKSNFIWSYIVGVIQKTLMTYFTRLGISFSFFSLSNFTVIHHWYRCFDRIEKELQCRLVTFKSEIHFSSMQSFLRAHTHSHTYMPYIFLLLCLCTVLNLKLFVLLFILLQHLFCFWYSFFKLHICWFLFRS